MPNLGCREAESPGWFGILPKNSAQDMMHEWMHCCDEAANHRLNHPNSFRRGMFKLKVKSDAESLVLNDFCSTWVLKSSGPTVFLNEE